LSIISQERPFRTQRFYLAPTLILPLEEEEIKRRGRKIIVAKNERW
jgi:hypothetical protein